MRLPKPAAGNVVSRHLYLGSVYTKEQMRKFAEKSVLAEREECAKVCENNSASYSERASRPEKVRDINPEVARVAVQTCGHVAAAIRARGT